MRKTKNNDAEIRYRSASNVLELVQLMLGKANGITIDEICDRFDCSRRTAERMRDAILGTFANVDVLSIDGKIKRWGFTDYRFQPLVEFTEEEIKLIEILKYSSYGIYQDEIKVIIDKMKALKQKRHI